MVWSANIRLLVLSGVLCVVGHVGEARARQPPRADRTAWRLRELRNFRDAGALLGLPAGRIYRSDDPRHRPFGACERLRGANIRTIVKLNADQHRFRAGRRPRWGRGPCGIPELAVPLPYERTEGAHHTTVYAIGRPRSDSAARRRVVSDMESQLGLLFRELARLGPHRLPVLFHCSMGRDRTGVVLALLGLIAGARPADVEADYVASAETVGHTSVYSLRRLLRRVSPIRKFFQRDLRVSEWDMLRLRRLLRGGDRHATKAAPIAPPRLPFGPPL